MNSNFGAIVGQAASLGIGTPTQSAKPGTYRPSISVQPVKNGYIIYCDGDTWVAQSFDELVNTLKLWEVNAKIA